MIKWKEEYRLGVETIDEQHMQLLAIADKAYELLKNELVVDKYDRIVAILAEMKDYTVYHFRSEEEYMNSIGYKRLLSHKVDHADFIDKVNDIDLKRLENDQDNYLLGILDFVAGWIDSHILKKDKLIVAE